MPINYDRKRRIGLMKTNGRDNELGSFSAESTTLIINIFGWIDTRGKDD